MGSTPSLVIVDQVDVVCVTCLKTEYDSPVARNREAPERLHITLRTVEPVTRQVEVCGCDGIVQVRQSECDPFPLV